MAEFTLQYPTEIQNGPNYKVKAQHLTDNFSALKGDIDDRLSKVASSAQTVTSAVTFTGQSTHTGGVKTDAIAERTSANGVNIDSVLLKDGFVKVGSAGYTPAADGEFGYDSTDHAYKVRVNGTNRTVYHDGNAPLPTGFIGGKAWARTSTTEITIYENTCARSVDDTDNLVVTGSDLVLDITDSGANGLDTGSPSSATTTPYFVWLIKKSSDGTVAGLLSLSATSPTMPADYDLKRRMPGWVVRHSDNTFIPFYFGAGYPTRPYVHFETPMTVPNGANGKTIIVNAASGSTSYSSADCSALCPESVAKSVLLNVSRDSGNVGVDIRNGTGTGLEFNIGPAFTGSGSSATSHQVEISLDGADGTIDWKTSAASGSISIDVMGGVDTGVMG